MLSIQDIAQQVMATGYLTIATENQLRQLLKTECDWEDLNAFWALQEAAMEGRVRQESRERYAQHALVS